MNALFSDFFGSRVWTLFLKEFQQIKRNKRLVVVLVIPPTLNIVLFGFALNPKVTNLNFGVVDQSRTADSRELVSAFVESRSFQITTYYSSTDELGRALSAGDLNAGLVIPYDYAKKRHRQETAEVQLLIDAVDSNTAAIAAGYAGRIIAAFNNRMALAGTSRAPEQVPSTLVQLAGSVPAASDTSIALTSSAISATPPPLASPSVQMQLPAIQEAALPERATAAGGGGSGQASPTVSTLSAPSPDASTAAPAKAEEGQSTNTPSDASPAASPAVSPGANPVQVASPTVQPSVPTASPLAAAASVVPPAESPTVLPTPTPVMVNATGPLIDRSNITARVSLLYNPGLRNSWFIATGLIGSLLVIQGSLVSAASMVKEKEVGTVEQLLMTPAEAGEIIIAKIAPIFLLLTADIGLALIVARLVFGVPVHGSLLLLFIAGSMCVLSGIGIGTLIATFTRSQQQAQLMGFFVNPPIVMLSGATTPVEAMPHWLQPLTYINPVRHFTIISRGIMLKGTGLAVLYPHVLALLCFAVLLVGISAWQFRKQLG